MHLLAATQGEYGWLSLVPPIVAIGLAIITRRIVASLLAGVIVAAWLISVKGPIASLSQWLGAIRDTTVTTVAELLYPSLASYNHLRIFAFTLAMSAMVGVIHRSGGMHGLVRIVSPMANTRRRGQLATWLLGMIVFFDDYANTLLLGATMRSVTDRLKISREKLAYLVDSTSAPVAGIALLSTWVAGEIGYIQSGLDKMPELAGTVTAVELFVTTIPYRFYILWTLIFIPIIAWTGRDFGPMLRAERRSHCQDDIDSPEQVATHSMEPPDTIPHRASNALLPVAVVLVTAVVVLILTRSPSGPKAKEGITSILDGDAYTSLVAGSLAGLLTISLLVLLQRLMSWHAWLAAIRFGCQVTLPALIILWLAWALGIATESYLKTGPYLGTWLRENASPASIPTIVFLLSAAVSFSTGTSWGTMTILTPMAMSATVTSLTGAGVASPLDHPILIAAIGSVLAGAIFGDHCSPISDTTILSSTASGCNHIAHVKTQLPYAVVVAAVTVICGTIPIGMGIPLPIVHIGGLTAMLIIVLAVGKPVQRRGEPAGSKPADA